MSKDLCHITNGNDIFNILGEFFTQNTLDGES